MRLARQTHGARSLSLPIPRCVSLLRQGRYRASPMGWTADAHTAAVRYEERWRDRDQPGVYRCDRSVRAIYSRARYDLAVTGVSVLGR
jgi:hypothetical protein